MINFRLALRMLARDWRAGELTVLGIALMLAVAALTSVGFLSDRVEQALKLESHQLLGGDLLLTADHPWSEAIRQELRQRGLQTAESMSFASMVAANETTQLVEIKAVSANYPLRGTLRVASALNQADAAVDHVPASGEVWPDERTVTALSLQRDARLGLGQAQLTVGPVLTVEPDRGMNVFALAPRLMLNLADVERTGLIQRGSRVAYRLHVAGEATTVADFERWVTPRLGRGQKLESMENARPEVRNLIERAQRFMRLVALLAVVLAAVAVALAAERYLRRHLDACAVMRCMGARESQLLAIHGGEFLLFGLLATLAGSALGYGVQMAMQILLAGLLFPSLPTPSLLPWLHGILVGVVLVAGFALPPLLRLKRVPTIRVLRREWDDAGSGSLLAYLAGALALAMLMLWMARDVKLWLVVLLGFLLALALYAGGAVLLLALIGRLRPAGGGYGWRHGLANLARHRRSTLVQGVALGLGLTALLLLTVARGDLLDNWRKKSPPDAPNRFVINIQPEQRDDFTTFFTARGLVAPALLPMVRGRLIEVNGKPVLPSDYEDERAQRLVDREFNLSWAAKIPDGNTVSAGRWFSLDNGVQEFSVEQGLAETLGLKLGDTLLYDIAGQRFSAPISSLRKLDWDSMRVNFFVLAPPGKFQDYPASYITSFHLPDDRAALAVDLVRRFPNLTLIDVTTLVRQVQSTLDQVSRAIQLVFGFALFAGLAVLYAALQASGDERRQELAVLRALGARQQQLSRALVAEFAALGALAGVLAGVGSSLIAWGLARFVFRLDYWPNPQLWAAGFMLGVVLVGIAGVFGSRPFLRQPAIGLLRGAG